MQADLASGLRTVRLDVERACGSLVLASPEDLTSCESALQRAAVALRQGRALWDWKSPREADRVEAARLQAGIRLVGRLLSNAARYHAGWLQVLSTMTCGYSPQGEAVPLSGARRISLEG